MLVHMRTTVRLDEGLMRQVKAEAARRGQTVTELIEKGLHLVLAGGGRRTRRERVVVPVSRATGGTHPGVELDDSSALLDRLEGRP
jgi:ribbon-helix-helix CopG family protein